MHYVHDLDPIIFSLGPLTVRWYGMMYLIGFALGWKFLSQRWNKGLYSLNPDQTGNQLTMIMIFMMIFARLAYVFVYNWDQYAQQPGEILKVWHGGLSYHGAAVGFVLAIIVYGKMIRTHFFHIADGIVLGAAQGVFFGRLGNFINGELVGRATDVPWGVIFPQYGNMPRHPSQLYQALMEGLLTFIILLWIEKYERKKGYAPQPHTPSKKEKKKNKTRNMEWKRTGILTSWYLILYGVFRFIIEFFREPDQQLGYYFGWMTMGQILCTLMILAGALLLTLRIKQPLSIRYTR